MLRKIVLMLVAAIALGNTAMTPDSASARTSHAVHSLVGSHETALGWGYGRGWCYWHPYVCSRA